MSLSLLLAMPASTFSHHFLGPIIPTKRAKRNKKKEIAKGLMHRTQQKKNLILVFMLPAYPDFKNKIHKYEVYFYNIS